MAAPLRLLAAVGVMASIAEAFVSPLCVGGLDVVLPPSSVRSRVGRGRMQSLGQPPTMVRTSGRHEEGEFKGRREVSIAILAGLLLGQGASPAQGKVFDEESTDKILAGYDILVSMYGDWDKFEGKVRVFDTDGRLRLISTADKKSPIFGIRKVLKEKGLDRSLYAKFDVLLTKIDNGEPDAKDAAKESIKVYKGILKDLDLGHHLICNCDE